MDIDYDKIAHYTAYAKAGHGAGSWGSGKTAFEAIDRCRRIFKDDWRPYGKGYIHVHDTTNVESIFVAVSGVRGYVKKDDTELVDCPYLFSVSVDYGPQRKQK